MADERRLIEALRRADAAGNTQDAQRFADEIKKMRAGPAAPYGVGNAMSQGATFGFADEAASGVLAGTVGLGKGVYNAVKERDIGAIPRTVGQEFVDLQGYQRRGKEKFGREHPAQALGAEIAGGLISGGAGVKTAAAGAKTLGGQVVRGAGAGAAQGGLYGLGSAEGDLAERAPEALTGAAFGGVAGAAFPVVVNKVSQFWRARAAKGSAPADVKRAYGAIRDLLEYDLGSRSRAEAALRVVMKNGAKPEDLLDAGGPALQTLQREIAAQRPTSAVAFVDKIRSQSSDDVRSAVASSIGKKGVSVRASREALKLVREGQAAPHFQKARQTPIPEGFADDLIRERPSVRAAVTKAARELADSQDGTPFEVLKVAKENLDDRVTALYRAGKSSEARRVKIARDELRKRLTELSPDYAEGLNIYAGAAAADDALDLGKKVLLPSYTADDLAAELAKLGDSEKEFLRVAVAEQIENVIDGVKDGSNVARRFADERWRRKIRTLFENDQEGSQAFIELIKKAEERAIKAGRIDPFSGSQTQPRLRAEKAYAKATEGAVERAADFALENPTQIPRKVVRAATSATRGARGERISDILEEVFFKGGNPQALTPQASPLVQIPYRPVPALNPALQNQNRE